MKPTLSILIPCYRVEQYIRQCLDSVFAVNLPEHEYEVLCFDDQSPDNTLHVLHEYAQKHPNMRVVCSNTNVGPGGGRNSLFAHAKGKYLWFVDGDDLIIPEVVGELIDCAQRKNLDVLVFNYTEWNEDKSKIEVNYSLSDSELAPGLELADQIFKGGLVNNMGYPVRFLIRREYLAMNNISFPVNMRYGEDTVWMAKVVLYAQRMMATSICSYIYWHHESSTCGILKRVYPGRTIYEKCIVTPYQLFEFVNDLRNKYELSNNEFLLYHANKIEKFASSHYINNLPVMLSRSTYKERYVFYNKLSSDLNVNEIVKRANLITRLLLLPIVGKYICECFALFYQIKHN